MNKLSRGYYAAIGAAILSAAVLTCGWASLNPSKKAPDFTLQSIAGKRISLSQLRKNPARGGASKVVLIDFWATWCPPCKEEAPHLQKLRQKFAGKGLAIVGIALDDNGAEAVKPFAREHGLTYNILLDPRGTTARSYAVRAMPTTVLIDRTGAIRYTHIGFYDGMERQIETEINVLLKE